MDFLATMYVDQGYGKLYAQWYNLNTDLSLTGNAWVYMHFYQNVYNIHVKGYGQSMWTASLADITLYQRANDEFKFSIQQILISRYKNYSNNDFYVSAAAAPFVLCFMAVFIEKDNHL